MTCVPSAWTALPVAWFAICFAAGSALAQDSTRLRGASAPVLPHIELRASLGEGHQYGRWKALRNVAVHDTWKKGRKVVSRIAPGETIVAESSVVVTTKPGVIRMGRDLATHGLKRGDEILTYGFENEGFSKVWFKGRLYADFDISFTKWPDGAGCQGGHCAATYIAQPELIRWVKVRLMSGLNGWVSTDDAAFAEVDKLQHPPFQPKPR
ncbi:MAG TPA: hypothetical protein PKJ41_07075 [Bryobacteraceae bacterium]|nr:hypothetical protein [Bryobacteraceae bacterium]